MQLFVSWEYSFKWQRMQYSCCCECGLCPGPLTLVGQLSCTSACTHSLSSNSSPISPNFDCATVAKTLNHFGGPFFNKQKAAHVSWALHSWTCLDICGCCPVVFGRVSFALLPSKTFPETPRWAMPFGKRFSSAPTVPRTPTSSNAMSSVPRAAPAFWCRLGPHCCIPTQSGGAKSGAKKALLPPRCWGSKTRALQESRAGKDFYGVARSRSQMREEEVRWQINPRRALVLRGGNRTPGAGSPWGYPSSTSARLLSVPPRKTKISSF